MLKSFSSSKFVIVFLFIYTCFTFTVESSENFNTTHIFEHKFSYIIDNQCTNCSYVSVVLLIVFFGTRRALREFYSEEYSSCSGVYIVFLLGMFPPDIDKSGDYQRDIFNENNTFKDIVQGNFLDTYKNLTYKSIMGIRWAVMRCKKVSYLVKVDDDELLDVKSFVKLLKSKEDSGSNILGRMGWDPPSRPYTMGFVYAIRLQAAEKMLMALKSERKICWEDLFVTGVLAKKANLKLEDLSEFLSYRSKEMRSCIQAGNKCKYVAVASDRNSTLVSEFKNYLIKHPDRNITSGKFSWKFYLLIFVSCFCIVIVLVMVYMLYRKIRNKLILLKYVHEYPWF